MSFGGGSKTQEVTQKTEIPAWVKQAGEALFNQGKDVAARPFPVYGGERIADFSPEQLRSFDMTEGNVGSWMPAFMQAFQGAGAGAAPIEASDISRFMNPFTSEVVNRAVEDMSRQANRDTIDRHASMAKRGSYMTEDRRETIDNLANEALGRNIGSVSANLYNDAFTQALLQANQERGRSLESSRIYGALAPQVQQLGQNDAEAIGEVGDKTQLMDQTKLSLQYEDFLREFGYPQEMINWLTSLLSGVPYETKTTGTQPVGRDNTGAQLAGAGISAAGLIF